MSVSTTKTVFQDMDVGDINDIHSLSSDTNTNTARTSPNISPKVKCLINKLINNNNHNNTNNKDCKPFPFSLPPLNAYHPPTLVKSNILSIENNNIISNRNVYLYGQCNNVPESPIPFHLQSKQFICDPTGKNGVFSPYISFSYALQLPLLNIQPYALPNINLDLPQLQLPILPFLELPKLTFEKQTNINEKQTKTLETKKTKTVNKPFKCDKCKKRFRNKSGLSNHKIIHNGLKAHKCRFASCNKAFARSCDLTRHTRLHTGHKPFRCTFKSCNKAFTRSVQLRLHVMDHSGIRPYHCSICKKGFKTLQNQQIHMRIHTGEKPYQCKFCKKKFTQSSSLRTHITSIHS